MPHDNALAERDTLAAIRLAVSRGPVRLFRMQSGTYELADGRYLTVGVPGLSDLIGWRSIRVTPGHLGQLLAVFTAIEAKSPTGRVTNEQARFLSVVEEAGGLSGIARSQEDARRILFLDGST